MTPDFECGVITGGFLVAIGAALFAGVWRLLAVKADIWRNIKGDN